jgi:LmbE family N-acetylglucosaminyl deacetylase
MKKVFRKIIFSLIIFFPVTNKIHAQTDTARIRVIMFGAHPDDCDGKAGGTAALYAQMGYAVKFVSVTNGDAGHQNMKGTELAKRRFAEAQLAGKRLGVTYDVLNNHDGQLLPSLEVRLEIIRKIREWNADIVFAPRPNDYHPDHRYTGILVQDAAYMVAVPNIAPETPALKKNPVFVYYEDRFKKPNPFHPDVVVDITETYPRKIMGMDAHQSQQYEWLPWIGGYLIEVPAGREDRVVWLSRRLSKPITPETRTVLEKWYGKEKADKAEHAESFEICEYGAQPTDADIKRLFPMLGQ